jgi:hypothetical protein
MHFPWKYSLFFVKFSNDSSLVVITGSNHSVTVKLLQS